MYSLLTPGRNEVDYIRCTIEKLKRCTLQISVFTFLMGGKYNTILDPCPYCDFVIYHVTSIKKHNLSDGDLCRLMKCNLPMICNLMVANRTSKKKYNHYFHHHHHHHQHCYPLSSSSFQYFFLDCKSEKI